MILSELTAEELDSALIIVPEGVGWIIGIRQEQPDGTRIAVFGDTFRPYNPLKHPAILVHEMKPEAGKLIGAYFDSLDAIKEAISPYLKG